MSGRPQASDIAALLERVTDRVAIDGHDGRSGARLERGVLDGRPVIVKTVDPDEDLSLLLGGDQSGRERRLWADGVLDRLPRGTGHALIAAGWTGGRLVTVMRDLGDTVLSWNRRIPPVELRRLFSSLTAVHLAFADRPPPGLCDLATRLTLFAPEGLGSLAGRFDLVAAVRQGWERFTKQVPAAIADAVFGTLRDPARLAATLGAAPPTLCHGDAWLVNVALTDDEVVLLDWALATAGAASLDFLAFTVGCASHVDLPRATVLAAAREASRPLVNDTVWDATVFWALCELGWNKALDATTHPDPAQRAAAAAELRWWVERADIVLSRQECRRWRTSPAACGRQWRSWRCRWCSTAAGRSFVSRPASRPHRLSRRSEADSPFPGCRPVTKSRFRGPTGSSTGAFGAAAAKN